MALADTFLEIVQTAFRESGLTGEGPVTVLSQVGRKGDMVKWVQEAYQEIQEERRDWKFDWVSGGPYTLNASQDTYDPVTDFSIVGGVRQFMRQPFGSYVFPTAAGINARGFMQFLPWERFMGLNIPTVNGSMPTVFTIRPDEDIQYWPTPSVACSAYHQFYRNPQTLVNNADEPRMPSRYRMVIVWKAVMRSCEKTNNWARFDSAEENYNRYLTLLLREQTPQLLTAGPMA